MNDNGMVDVFRSIVSICDSKSFFVLSFCVRIVDIASFSSPEVFCLCCGIPITTSDRSCISASSSGMNENSTISAVCFYSIEMLVFEFHHAIYVYIQGLVIERRVVDDCKFKWNCFIKQSWRVSRQCKELDTAIKAFK